MTSLSKIEPTREVGSHLPRRLGWIVTALFLAVYVLIVSIARRDFFFHTFTVPVGDAAADDLLIFRAKHFHLLTGNYSRVGFNHPGPFFLQMAAFGELLFFDGLHLFKSYFAAQLYTLSLLHGLALALALRFWLLVTKDVVASLTALFVMLAAISAYPYGNVFLDEWNPHSYVAGALALVIGLAGLWVRGICWAPLAAVGVVALVHGHACFIGLLPIILATYAVLLAIARRNELTREPMIVFNLIRSKPSLMAVVAAILALGALPIVINLALHWPGDFSAYFRLASQSKTNGLRNAAEYVWSFVPLRGAWLVLLLLPKTDQGNEPCQEDSRNASLAVFLAGLAGALFYAVRGVDSFSFRYLIYWVTPFVGLAASAAAIRFLFWLQRSWAKALVLVMLAIVCAVVLYQKPPVGFDPEETSALERAAAEMQAHTPPGERTAILLTPGGKDWGEMWSETVAVAALLQRQGSRALCVEAGWHILFTRRYHCLAGDRIARRLYLATPQPDLGSPVASFYRLAVYRVRNLMNAEAKPSEFWRFRVNLVQGWSASEGSWVWTDGRSPVLTLDTDGRTSRGELTLRGMVFSDGLTPQRVTLLDDQGRVLASASALQGDIALKAPVEFDQGKPGQILFRLKIAHPTTPKSIGQSQDSRQLGFGLKSVRLDAASPEH